MISKKKVLAVFLVVSMLFSVVACANNTDDSADTDAASETAGEKEEGDDKDTASVSGSEDWIDHPDFPGVPGLSKYPEPRHYTIGLDTGLGPVHKPGLSWDDNMWKTEREENMNIFLDVAWTAEGYEAYTQKLNLQIMSQDVPDLFACNAAQFQMLCENDLIQPLGDVLDAYATDFFKENMKAEGAVEALAQSTFDGQLMAIPLASADPGKQHSMFIREDWREALDAAVPTNMEELEELARAFTEDDPDGNGVDDTYGIGMGNKAVGTYMSLNGVANGFGAFPGIWIEKDGEIQYGSIQPEMKNALSFLSDMYSKGYLDREFTAKDDYAAAMDLVAGRGGIAFAEWWLLTWPLPDAYKNNHAWKAYPLPFDVDAPEKSVAGEQTLESRIVVSKSVEDPSVAVKLSNIYQERILGHDSDLTAWKGDGDYDFSQYTFGGSLMGPNKNLEIMFLVTDAIDKEDESILQTAEQRQVYGYVKGHLENTPSFEENPEGFATNYLFWSINYGKHESVYGIMNDYEENGMNKINIFKGAFGEVMTERMGQLESLTNETFTNIISGAAPLDSFDDYATTLFYEQGGTDVTQEVIAWNEANNE